MTHQCRFFEIAAMENVMVCECHAPTALRALGGRCLTSSTP